MFFFFFNVALRTGKRSGRKQEFFIFVLSWRMVSLFAFMVISLYTSEKKKTSEMSRWGMKVLTMFLLTFQTNSQLSFALCTYINFVVL